MKWSEWLKKWDIPDIKISKSFLDLEFKPKESDKLAAWNLYVELLTRITTQPLPKDHGDEETALKSVYSIFNVTRDVIKSNGPTCIEFTKMAILLLNQIIRPFTAKWHGLLLQGAFNDRDKCQEFRSELAKIQDRLVIYTKMLADMAGVQDLTELEEKIV